MRQGISAQSNLRDANSSVGCPIIVIIIMGGFRKIRRTRRVREKKRLALLENFKGHIYPPWLPVTKCQDPPEGGDGKKIYPSPLKTILPLTTTHFFLLSFSPCHCEFLPFAPQLAFPFIPHTLLANYYIVKSIPNKVYVLLSNSNLYIFFFRHIHISIHNGVSLIPFPCPIFPRLLHFFSSACSI